MNDPDRPLNLLVVTNDLLVGGVQRNVVRYFQHFDRERFRLHLVTVCASGPLAAEVRQAGACYEHLRAIAGVGPLKTITPRGVWRLSGGCATGGSTWCRRGCFWAIRLGGWPRWPRGCR